MAAVRNCLANRSPSSPLAAQATLKPAFSNVSRKSSWTAMSSSIMSTVLIPLSATWSLLDLTVLLGSLAAIGLLAAIREGTMRAAAGKAPVADDIGLDRRYLDLVIFADQFHVGVGRHRPAA